MSELIHFVRIKSGSRKGQKIGVVIATGCNRVGWSRCNTKAGDKFDKTEALRRARERANTGGPDCCNKVPRDVDAIRIRMRERSQRYFKAVDPRA